MERIGDDVRQVLGRFGTAGRIGEVARVWPTAVGDAIARNAWPARIARDGTLHVAASSSAWAFELTQLEGTVRERLRRALGASAPTKLRFAPGRLPERGAEAEAGSVSDRPRPAEEDRARAAELANAIEDEELRELVARAAAASLASARSDRGL
jgi:hypothetical protein